jgi:hypothetical protein
MCFSEVCLNCKFYFFVNANVVYNVWFFLAPAQQIFPSHAFWEDSGLVKEFHRYYVSEDLCLTLKKKVMHSSDMLIPLYIPTLCPRPEYKYPCYYMLWLIKDTSNDQIIGPRPGRICTNYNYSVLIIRSQKRLYIYLFSYLFFVVILRKESSLNWICFLFEYMNWVGLTRI